MKDGIPTSKGGDVDMLNMWLHLYHGDIEDDLSPLTRMVSKRRHIGSQPLNTSGFSSLVLFTLPGS
jgi:hypothetical protein